MQQSTKIDKDYLNWISGIKTKIRSTQIRAALAANAALIEFYYDLGGMIVEKQAQSAWGDKLVQQLSKDLQAEFPEMKGLSFTNLKYCKQFFNYFQTQPKTTVEISQQTVGQISPQSGGKLQIAENKQIIISPQLGGQLSPRDKNNIEAEFALRDIRKPMGVSEFDFTKILPEELKSSLPTIEELENSIEISRK